MRLGHERIAERPALFEGRRIGLITNHTGRATVTQLRERFQLGALFAPEHGLRGDAPEGERLASSVDAETGLPVHSLYGKTTRPTAAMLAGLDLLVYDIQDAGARCFTYLSTLLEAMRAAAQAGLPIVVLDRPVPTGGVDLDGPLLDLRFASFVGPAPVPLRYGLTPGEFASFCNARLGIRASLEVVPLEGWRRAMWFDDTGRPWVAPSPALRSLAACALYPGTVLFEATNVSEGRGTDLPFEWIGAPWLDAQRLARIAVDGVRLHAEPRAPVRFEAVCPGLRIEIVDRARLRPVAVGVTLLAAIRALHGEDLRIDGSGFDRLAGTDALRGALAEGAPAERIVESWRPGLATFVRERAPYLLY